MFLKVLLFYFIKLFSDGFAGKLCQELATLHGRNAKRFQQNPSAVL
jgi:hypothetical protein